MELRIRPATERDTELLAEIIQRSFQDVAHRFGLTPENCPKHPSNCTPEWILKDLTRGVIYSVAEQYHSSVGCVALEAPHPELRYLERLAVLPDSRHQGIGRALVTHALAQAKTSGAHQVSIGIIADQTELQQWYENLGFVEAGTKNFHHLPFQITFMEINIDQTASNTVEARLDGAPDQ